MLRYLAKRAAVPSAPSLAASSLPSTLSTSIAGANASLSHLNSNPSVSAAVAHHQSSSKAAFSTSTRNGKEKAVIPSASSSAPLLQVSVLPNGVRVATDATPGHFVSAGVYVGAGSRFEWAGNSGSSHMMDRLAFKSTKHRTLEQMSEDIEALGGQFLASSSREVIMYQAASYTNALPSVISLLTDTVLHSSITPEELDLQRQSAAWELEEIHSKPDMILPELLYEVAFQGNTLGNPLLIRQERLASIDVDTIRDFRKTWFRPERIVLAGAGIPHEQLVDLAHSHFSEIKAEAIPSLSQPQSPSVTSAIAASLATAARSIPTHLLQNSNSASSSSSSSSSPSFSTSSGWLRGKAPYATASNSFLSPTPSSEELASAAPVYTGGAVYDTHRAESMEFSYLYVGYEGLSIYDPDVYALATLQMLLGGGSSFSAGGPGKGMFSRLYTNLLNMYHDVEHCSAFHHCYLDTGLFAMCISVNPHFIGRAPYLIAEQLDSLTSGSAFSTSTLPFSGRSSRKQGINLIELNRAKNQLKSNLVMTLETRMIQVEDLGRQVLAHGHKLPIEEMLAKISVVSLEDLERVAKRIFRPSREKSVLRGDEKRTGEPSILAAGKLDGIPDVREVLKRYGLAP